MKKRRCSLGNVGICTFLYILLATPQLVHADESDLVVLAREGHRAALQSIHSFSATVRKKTTYVSQGKEGDHTAKYWRSFDTVHIREKHGGGTGDLLIKDGEIRRVSRGVLPPSHGGKVMYTASRDAEVEIRTLCDVWLDMLIDHINPNGGRCTMDRYLDSAARPLRAKRVREGGHNCINLMVHTISAMGTEYEGTLWYDVDRNYLIWKETGTWTNPSQRYEREILDFSEPVPGVFVPMKCRAQWFGADGAVISRVEMVLSDVEVNKPLPAGALQLPAIPAGTKLNDKIRGESYAINEKWERIGAPEPLRQVVVPSVADGVRSDFHSQSTSEAKPLSRMLAPISLLILVIVCTCLIYREYKCYSRPRLD